MRNWLARAGHLIRQGLPALALYALVLQAFLTGAAPAAAFNPEAAPLCAEMAAGLPHKAPADGSAHEQDCPCLAQCVQAHASIGLSPHDIVLPAHPVANVVALHIESDARVQILPLERGPGARAPPRG